MMFFGFFNVPISFQGFSRIVVLLTSILRIMTYLAAKTLISVDNIKGIGSGKGIVEAISKRSIREFHHPEAMFVFNQVETNFLYSSDFNIILNLIYIKTKTSFHLCHEWNL